MIELATWCRCRSSGAAADLVPPPAGSPGRRSAVRLSFSFPARSGPPPSDAVVWTIVAGPAVATQPRNRGVDHAWPKPTPPWRAGKRGAEPGRRLRRGPSSTHPAPLADS